jgi:pyruvate/2-oxoglutarate dehydrogenase complex dihydrolipoamide acyltransferase (E2) component
MHTMKKRATRLALAGLAVLMAATLAACGSDTSNPPPSPAQPAPAGPAATTPSKATTAQPAGRPAASPAGTSSGTDFGFIRSWTAKTGTFYLRFDRAVLLNGKAADAASAAHGGESPVPNDYYIQNDNPRLREVAIADQVKVIGSQQLTGSQGPKPTSLKALLTFVHNGGPLAAATPFHLTYNANGLVVRVQEQYVP